jgi:4-oxalocrotonate tautomerase
VDVSSRNRFIGIGLVRIMVPPPSCWAFVHESATMPTLRLEMHPGRTLEQKRSFVREATRVAAETLNCPPESVDIVIAEVPRDAWAKNGKLLADG